MTPRSLEEIAADMAAELRRLHCRKHTDAHCPRCTPVSEFDAWLERQKAEHAKERHGG
jgi:hypothetical protein